MGADIHPVVEIGHVVVDQAEAARRHRLTDGLRRVGAVDAVDGVAEIHGAGAERIAGAASHEARQIGLARDHLRRRMPIRPFGLARDLQQALPGEAIAADADAVADGGGLVLDQIEMALRRIDDDGAGRLPEGLMYAWIVRVTPGILFLQIMIP